MTGEHSKEEFGGCPMGARGGFFEEEAVETAHSITLGSTVLTYQAIAGRVPIYNTSQDDPQIEAQIFFVYYRLESDQPDSKRPITFAFNGGPDSASVWLHLGGVGPQRVGLNADGSLPPPPYGLVPNTETWLAETDLVFIDPVGTGFSRAKDEETANTFYEIWGDVASLTEFIRFFLTRYERWLSPMFLAGESYGTFRCGKLSSYLFRRGIACSGIIFLSCGMSLQALFVEAGNELPYSLFLPAMTATAWYHKQLAPELQSRSLPDILREVEDFAYGTYTTALLRGNRLPAKEREALIFPLARWTGLSEHYIALCGLRVHPVRFLKELLRDRGEIVGRYDSRLVARESANDLDEPRFDAGFHTLDPPFAATFNDYVRRTLRYKTHLPYAVAGDRIHREWKWAHAKFSDATMELAEAMAKNPHLRVLFACGYFDLATPYFASEYVAAHLPIDAERTRNVQLAYYPSGHMIYTEPQSRQMLQRDVADFISRETK